MTPHPQSLTASPEKFAATAQPGVMISNAWSDSRQTSGATQRAIGQLLARFPSFEAFRTIDMPFRQKRSSVRRLVHDSGQPHTYTLTRVLAETRPNLSSLDADTRHRSCEMGVPQFDNALEAGASAIGLISGPRSADPMYRTEAMSVFNASQATNCAAAEAFDGLEVLDCAEHKRCTLGTAAEAVAMCDRLARAGKRVILCLEVAHLIQNEEDILAAVEPAHLHLLEFHFCNAVTDSAHPLFGDYHLPSEAPGVVDVDRFASLMTDLVRTRYFNGDNRPRVFCEAGKPKDGNSLDVVVHCEKSRCEGWRRARLALAS